jgi:hypothetical protein
MAARSYAGLVMRGTIIYTLLNLRFHLTAFYIWHFYRNIYMSGDRPFRQVATGYLHAK